MDTDWDNLLGQLDQVAPETTRIENEEQSKIEKAKLAALEEKESKLNESQPIYQYNEIRKIIRQVILTYMKGVKYNHSKVSQWQQQISEHCLKKFTILKPPFPSNLVKYIVTSTIMQKSLTGFHSETSCFWDTELDRLVTYTHEDEDFVAIVNVFAIAV